MRRIFETIQKVAETDLTVLVRGESGTGKELVAQALHTPSGASHKPFVAVNCAAINRELVESELFGHEKGAFTGADSTSRGPLRGRAGRHDLPRRDRRHGARDAGEGAARAPGANRCSSGWVARESVEVDVRVVAATHRDLEAT